MVECDFVRAGRRGALPADDGETDMKSLKGTQTEKNLLTSFAGESQARNR